MRRGRAHAFEERREVRTDVRRFAIRPRSRGLTLARERHQAESERILEVDRRGLAADATPERRAAMVREPSRSTLRGRRSMSVVFAVLGAAADDRRQRLRAGLEPVDEMATQCLVATLDKGHVATCLSEPFANGL